ncbi:hypothetical protein Cgig2_016775 [Carnegiea gigantea]|uniref:Uncharacterized protein n=1 Tax=Carnegiea gigantea TaxID=171969 RepID=A0A9Q1JU23_9CARY|nr:hypothetical protein Cgig2_016775 [Carnegiea gigantea]
MIPYFSKEELFRRAIIFTKEREHKQLNKKAVRDKENGENDKCSKRNVEMAFLSETNLKRKRSAKVIPQNVTGSQELSKPTNLKGYRCTKVALQNAYVNIVPLCMNVPYIRPSSQGNIVPTLNLLPNSIPNYHSVCQNTIAAVGYCPPFYFDPRTARGLGLMLFQSFIGQTPALWGLGEGLGSLSEGLQFRVYELRLFDNKTL